MVGEVPTCVGDFITVMNKGVHVPVVGKKESPHVLTHLSQIVRFFLLKTDAVATLERCCYGYKLNCFSCFKNGFGFL